MLTHLFRIFKYGTSYAIATGFFPQETAQKVILLYSFVRIPDNIVDDVLPEVSLETHYAQAKIKLELLRDERTQAYTSNNRKDPTRGQYITLFQENKIPFQYSLDFLKAMIDDCTLHRYTSLKQLEGYMYGSASVVGLMMCHLVGFTDPKHEKRAKEYATELGNAMQLTNFLRDVQEDYRDLKRIYMPLKELEQHGLSHDDIVSFCTDPLSLQNKQQARVSYMKMMIKECRAMYTHSLIGLQYLQPEGRKAIELAAILYESILDKIENNNYDVFTLSARTHLRDKFKTLYRYHMRGKK